MPITAVEKRTQLMRDGFCIFENVLEPEMVAKLNAMSEWTIAQEDEEHFEQHRSQGCIIPYWKYPHPVFPKLIAHPGALGALAQLGFDQPKVWSGFVISKPPHSPPLYWHQDGVLWEHPISYTDKPQQYFLMYYLVDTNRNNGCLRLIPGSHLKRHPLHDLDRKAHDGDEVGRAKNMNHPAFQKAEDEVDVPVRAGDVVIGDARLLHSAHANQSDLWRTVLTIWYWAELANLPEAAQALVASHVTENTEWAAWSEQSDPAVQAMIPRYSGDVEPITWGRGPKKGLF